MEIKKNNQKKERKKKEAELYNGHSVDSETIFIYRAIKKCNPTIQIMTELVHDSNIEFLLPTAEIERFNKNIITYESTSVFSAGEVYVNSIIDTLTCQAYYNQHIVTIIHQLLTGGKNASNMLTKGALESVNLKSSNLWQIDIPENFINKTYIELFKAFCKKNVIALGLYRLSGAKDNNNSYVYTKPHPKTRLTPRDRIFILCIESIQKYNFKDIKRKVQNDLGENKMTEKEPKEEEDELKTRLEDDDQYNPLQYMNERLDQMERDIAALREHLRWTHSSIEEGVSSGIRNEFAYLLGGGSNSSGSLKK